MKTFDTILRAGEGRKKKQFNAIAEQAERIYSEIADLSDQELQSRYQEIADAVRKIDGDLTDGDQRWPLIAEHCAEVFALVRHAAKRTLGLEHYPCQLFAGAALAHGVATEMQTGEGKTLTATLPLALHALGGQAHLVTANEYLARRDCEWMLPVYEFLGLSAAALHEQQDLLERKQAYDCDIVYGTAPDFGFDYLRDNIATDSAAIVQGQHRYALIDEVDSILIDQARTPLLISGAPIDSSEEYRRFAACVAAMDPEQHFDKDLVKHAAWATEEGVEFAEQMLGIDHLYAPENGHYANHLAQAIRARVLYHVDRDYIVDEGKIVIIDEYTGRSMPDRRWQVGLHQAISAKEGLEPEVEYMTVAEVTVQNYFRMYEHLAGMSGTVMTETTEFGEIYKLDVIAVPTHLPSRRIDHEDVFYTTRETKLKAVIAEIARRHALGQPVLCGTIAVEDSEQLSQSLAERGITHRVLNAKEHGREAEIIAAAGQLGAVTIATNMAGRGVDIAIDDEVRDLGGLFVIGTERAISRRIDNQLRGRSGRQGDPGETVFYISADDEVARIFGGDRMASMLERLGMGGDRALAHTSISKQIEAAQKRAEEVNFEARKNTVEFDDVLDVQRKLIYGQRREVVLGHKIEPVIVSWLESAVADIVSEFDINEDMEGLFDYDALADACRELWPLQLSNEQLRELELDKIESALISDILGVYSYKRATFEIIDLDFFADAARGYMLQTLDREWQQHIEDMEYLRMAVSWRGLIQIKPIVAYRIDGSLLFQHALTDLRRKFTKQFLGFGVLLFPPNPESDYLTVSGYEPHEQLPEWVRGLSKQKNIEQQQRWIDFRRESDTLREVAKT